MKIQEVTQTNEVDVNAFLDRGKKGIKNIYKAAKTRAKAELGNQSAQKEILVTQLAKELAVSFKTSMAQAGITNKNQFTSEDLAEFLLQAGIQTQAVSKAFAQFGIKPEPEPEQDATEQPVESKMFFENTPLPPAKMLDIINTALQLQSRAGALEKIEIPAYAGNPTRTARAIFKSIQASDKGDEKVLQTAQQIMKMSPDQRSELTAILTGQE